MVEISDRIALARLLASLESPEMVSTKLGNMAQFVGKIINIIGTREAVSIDEDGTVSGEYRMLVFEYDGGVYNCWLGKGLQRQIDILESNQLLPVAAELQAVPTKKGNDMLQLRPSSIVDCAFKIPELAKLLESRAATAAIADR